MDARPKMDLSGDLVLVLWCKGPRLCSVFHATFEALDEGFAILVLFLVGEESPIPSESP